MELLLNCCRICLNAPFNMTTIYAIKRTRYLPSVIYNISGVKVLQQIEPNAKICKRCAEAVIAAETIILKCQEAEEFFSQPLAQKIEKDEIKYIEEPKTNTNPCTKLGIEPNSDSAKEGTGETLDRMTTAKEICDKNPVNFEHVSNDVEMHHYNTDTNYLSVDETHSNFDNLDGQSEETILGEEFNKPIDVKKTNYRRANQTERTAHTCQYCDYRCKSRICLVSHYREIHNLDESCMYKCSLCSQTFSWRRSLFFHIEKEHKIMPKEKKYLCEECGKSYFKKRFLNEHIEQRHSQKLFKCPQPDCDKSFNRKFTVRRHFESMHTDVKRYQCEQCDMYFSCLDKWRYHVEAVHERKHCPQCGMWFRKQKVLDAHIASKKCQNCIYKCPHCPRRFITTRNIQLHMENVCKYNNADAEIDIDEY